MNNHLTETEKQEVVNRAVTTIMQTCMLRGINYLSLDKKTQDTMLSIFIEGAKFIQKI
jgi:hypothetical protein